MWGVAAREAWLRLRRRLRSGPIHRWRYSGRTPERVLIAPPDLRRADPQVASEIYHGRFPLAGQVVETGGRSPFQIETASIAWRRSLHGFRWLRHMHAAQTELAASNARALVKEWLIHHDRRLTGIAWDPAVTARRLIAWLQHSTLILQGSDLGFYRRFLKSLAMQIRYLRSVVAEMPDGEERLRARAALAFSALSLPVAPTVLRVATKQLALEIERQILPDGGHVSRNPHAIPELLADLLPLRQTYANQAEAPPEALISAVERMLPALRFFRHQDGTLARFNGMGQTVHDRVATILHYDDTGGAPLFNASYSGYQRLSQGRTTVIADTGVPPGYELSNEAHAGCLSFELSSGRHHYIVNAGVDMYGPPDLRPLARATAAHSTLVLNDTSSARFGVVRGADGIMGTPLIGGPREVICRRLDDNYGQGFVARHDGYVDRFDLVHERELVLSGDGLMLEGVDRVTQPGGAPAIFERGNKAAIRFHVHPDTELYHDERGRLVLAAAYADSWTFTCEEVAPTVEDSIFFAGLGGPRRCRQIVLAYSPADHPEVSWRFLCNPARTVR